MATFCSLLTNTNANFDRTVAAKGLFAIVTGIVQHFDIYESQLFLTLVKLFDTAEYVYQLYLNFYLSFFL
jgi:hypothetical protein